MTVHALKTDPEVFRLVMLGIKSCEVRFNDRNFQVGDILVLRETVHSGLDMREYPDRYLMQYTGRSVDRVVSHVLHGYGLIPGWVALSFSKDE